MAGGFHPGSHNHDKTTHSGSAQSADNSSRRLDKNLGTRRPWTVRADRQVGAFGGSSHALFVQSIALQSRDLRLGDARRVAHDSCYWASTVDQLPENTTACHSGGSV